MISEFLLRCCSVITLNVGRWPRVPCSLQSMWQPSFSFATKEEPQSWPLSHLAHHMGALWRTPLCLQELKVSSSSAHWPLGQCSGPSKLEHSVCSHVTGVKVCDVCLWLFIQTNWATPVNPILHSLPIPGASVETPVFFLAWETLAGSEAPRGLREDARPQKAPRNPELHQRHFAFSHDDVLYLGSQEADTGMERRLQEG